MNWTTRVQLPRGRTVHAARYQSGTADPVTACKKVAADADHLDDTEAVTCVACRRATGQ
jgi:hypothetical protein